MASPATATAAGDGGGCPADWTAEGAVGHEEAAAGRNSAASPEDGRRDAYAAVQERLLWFWIVHPAGAIETELMRLDGAFAVFRARVSAPDVLDGVTGTLVRRGGSATGWGSEAADVREYIEQAETKALGRALAALGFVTPFCRGFDADSEVGDGAADAAMPPELAGTWPGAWPRSSDEQTDCSDATGEADAAEAPIAAGGGTGE
jgi:hypothetical protein